MEKIEYGYFPVRERVGQPLLRAEDVMVYRIGPRGGVQGYEGICRVDELTKFYGNAVRIPSGRHEAGRWVKDEWGVEQDEDHGNYQG